MPDPIPSNTDDGSLHGQGRYMAAVDDDELGLVAGGQQYVFRGEGFQRDSWFVTFMLKRMIQDSKEKGTLIDATHGRRTRAVLITDSDHVILTYLQSETVANRLNDDEASGADEEEADDA